MKVTAIEQRKKGLTAIFTDDGDELLIDSELVIIRNISVGSVIGDAEELSFESDFKRAKSRALWYLARADYSKKALIEKLCKGGFSNKASLSAVDCMEELGLVNDERLAARMAEYLNESGVSQREIYFKLINKGIPREIASELSCKNCGDEKEKIKKLLKTKYATRLKDEESIKKVFAALVRKGFSFSDVRNVLRKYSDEINNSEEF